MIYLDNCATTAYKPPCVKNAAVNCMEHLCANAGRSGHKKSVSAAMLVYRTRKKTADFTHCTGDVAFTLNCSEALNLAILGSVVYGGHIVTTLREHNSVLRPLFELERSGKISLSVVQPDSAGNINFQTVRPYLKSNTYLVAVNHVSNVTGEITDVGSIGNGLKGSGIRLLVDGAQSAGYLDLNMERDNISYLALAPHKGLHGIQGVGALCVEKGLKLRPIKFGGTGTQSLSVYQPSDAPECYESGTLPLVAIAAMNRALDYTKTHLIQQRQKVLELTKQLYTGLKEISGVKLISKADSQGIVSFNVKQLSSDRVCDVLDARYDIAARGGLHCAPLIHKYNDTVGSGAVRMSPGIDNTEYEIEQTVAAVKQIAADA